MAQPVGCAVGCRIEGSVSMLRTNIIEIGLRPLTAMAGCGIVPVAAILPLVGCTFGYRSYRQPVFDAAVYLVPGMNIIEIRLLPLTGAAECGVGPVPLAGAYHTGTTEGRTITVKQNKSATQHNYSSVDSLLPERRGKITLAMSHS